VCDRSMCDPGGDSRRGLVVVQIGGLGGRDLSQRVLSQGCFAHAALISSDGRAVVRRGQC